MKKKKKKKEGEEDEKVENRRMFIFLNENLVYNTKRFLKKYNQIFQLNDFQIEKNKILNSKIGNEKVENENALLREIVKNTENHLEIEVIVPQNGTIKITDDKGSYIFKGSFKKGLPKEGEKYDTQNNLIWTGIFKNGVEWIGTGRILWRENEKQIWEYIGILILIFYYYFIIIF